MTTLEKIRAEIEEERVHDDWNFGQEIYYNNAIDDVLQIIDKYAEQEPCDDDYQTDMDEAWKQAKRDCPNCIWHDTSCTKFYCQQIKRRQIMIILSLLEICEGVQADDKAGFMEKETAKVVAYEHIAEILKGVQNDTKGS